MSPSQAPNTAIVGAGLVGLLAAWQLRTTGHHVTIFDPEAGQHASYAAAGMLAPVSEVQYGQHLLWPLMTAARAEYPTLIAQLEAATRTPTGYRENGTLLIAHDSSDRSAVADLVGVQQEHGMDVAPLTSRELRNRESGLAPSISKAWEIPSDHQVNPRQLMACTTAALNAQLKAEDFPDAGPPAQWVDGHVSHVEQPEGSPPRLGWVESASHGGANSAADTGHGDDDKQAVFDHVVLAPGLGYPDISGVPQDHPLNLRPVYGEVIRLRTREDQLHNGEDQILNFTIRATVRGRSVYLVPRAADDPLEPRGVVVGASSREDDLNGIHAGNVAELLEDAITVLPAVREMELTEITARARPGTPDDRPYLGKARDVVISTGYHRHGILLAPLAARLTAALLNGTELSAEEQSHLEAMALQR